jgi:hypothetical protein
LREKAIRRLGNVRGYPSTPGFCCGHPSLYDKQCVGCHAADGKGNPAMIKALGAGKMPAAKSLNAQEQKQVLSYIRSLAKQPPR